MVLFLQALIYSEKRGIIRLNCCCCDVVISTNIDYRVYNYDNIRNCLRDK